RQGELSIEERLIGKDARDDELIKGSAGSKVDLYNCYVKQALADMMEKESKVKWGNRISFVLLPFTIAIRDDPFLYIRDAKAVMDRKKLSYEAICTFRYAHLVFKLFGLKPVAALTHKIVSNTTLAFSNVVGPQEEISLYGHPVTYIAPTVYGHPLALTLHFQSYCDKLTISMAVDEDVIPDPHRLCNDLEESINIIKAAVLKTAFPKNVV
ncbi:hypothetical protein RJ640_000495, partial [Escallonia rubra]